MKKRTRTRLIVVAAILAVGWVSYTPYLAVEQMRQAAENRDAVTLSQYINYPAVRESLKANLNAKMVAEIGKRDDKNPFVLIGAALATSFIGPFVDSLVTPDGMAMMMRGDKPSFDKSRPSSTSVSASDALPTTTTMGYESFDEFVVKNKKAGEAEPVVLIFRRENIVNWKLSAIRLPL
jgi:hypothetical protein